MCYSTFFIDGMKGGKLYGENVFRLRPEINQGTKLLSLVRGPTFHLAREH